MSQTKVKGKDLSPSMTTVLMGRLPFMGLTEVPLGEDYPSGVIKVSEEMVRPPGRSN